MYVAAGLGTSDTLVNNGINGTIEGTMSDVVVGHGEVPILIPGEYSEIVVLTEDSSGSANSSYTVSVRHRPRRSTI